MAAIDVMSYFQAIRAVYAEHGAGSPFSFGLAPGAKAATLSEVERELACVIHPELAAMWAFANGSLKRAPMFMDGVHLSSLAMISTHEAAKQRAAIEKRASHYEGVKERSRDPRVGEGWFSSGWVPFAALEGGSILLLVDHTPLGSGHPGQVIGFVHDPDEIVFVASSLADLLKISLTEVRKDPLEFLSVF